MVEVGGQAVETLQELLRPGLRIVVIGINPSPPSVRAGHFYQGRLGKLFWKRIQSAGIATGLTAGREDLDALAQGVGFADILRYPTANAKSISLRDLKKAVPNLEARLEPTGCRRLLFVFSQAYDAARELQTRRYELFRMPAPFAKRAEAEAELIELGRVLAAQQVS